jgi:hypothetical protein
VADNKRTPFRFTLRSLFFVVSAGAVLSACVRGDPTMLLGIGAFCYGGIVAIPCYALVASLIVVTTKTTWGERIGEVSAGLVAAAAWITFIIGALGQWPQLCVVYSFFAIAILAAIVWHDWQPVAGPSPEATLERLLQAKHDCAEKLRREQSDTNQRST